MSRPPKYDQDEHQKIAVATRLVARRWADSIRDQQRPPELPEVIAIASSAGVRDPEAVGAELQGVMHDTYLGALAKVTRPSRWQRIRDWWEMRRGRDRESEAYAEGYADGKAGTGLGLTYDEVYLNEAYDEGRNAGERDREAGR